MRKLNEIYCCKTEEYSFDAVNKFNIYPDQISPWFVEWMPDKGGYFIGNLQPAHMDFRFFSLGNLWSIVNSLATTQQFHAILDLVEAKLSDLLRVRSGESSQAMIQKNMYIFKLLILFHLFLYQSPPLPCSLLLVQAMVIP